MSDWFLASYYLLWLLFCVQAVVTLLALRQIGILHLRSTAPVISMKARVKEGDPAPTLVLADSANPSVELRVPPPDGRSMLLLFITPKCPACKAIAPHVARLASEGNGTVDWGIVALGDLADCNQTRSEYDLDAIPFCVGNDSLREEYGLVAFPYGFLIDSSGIVRGSEPVGTREQLEALLKKDVPTISV
ncbi:MAG: hypothetical protein HY000_05735 [Planctomycetes bacterium]|nr:hypothetical protein [Planctomycetota bacterium]